MVRDGSRGMRKIKVQNVSVYAFGQGDTLNCSDLECQANGRKQLSAIIY